MKDIPILSFFSGGGFLDMGFEEAGFDILWSNEYDPHFADMYEAGLSSWRIANGKFAVEISNRNSITDLSAREIVNEAFKGKRPEKIFGMIGGPPCPDFSIGGKNRGHKGARGKLTGIFLSRILNIKPSFFVLENVPGLFKIKKHWRVFEKLLLQFENNGYCVDSRLLNALEFGCPQDRERLFVIGIRKTALTAQKLSSIARSRRDWFPWPKPPYEGAKQKYKWPLIDSFGTVPTKPHDVPYQLTVCSVLNGENPPDKLSNGDEHFNSYSGKFATTAEGCTAPKSFKRLHRYRYSPTVCYGNNEVHLHPWKERRLTVREALRLQGVPDAYVLPSEKPLTRKFKLIANGVPVPLAFALASSIKKFFHG